jgi:hypothetical protein
MRFPESVDSLSGNRIDLQLTKQDSQEQPTASAPLYAGQSKPYIGLRYMNPFSFWIPVPLLRYTLDENDPIRVDGGGILSMMADPADRNMITLLAYADVQYKMAMVDQFIWQNTGLGFPLAVNFSDKVEESGNSVYRYTSASLSGTLNWQGNQWSNQVLLGGGYARAADYEYGKGAYEWEERGSAFFMQAGFLFSYRRLSLQFSGVSMTNSFEPRIDMIFRASAKTRFPLGFTLFGAYDKRGMDLHGISNTFGSTTAIAEFVLEEYPHPSGLDLFWLGGGEISLGLFSFEIQKNLSHFFFNRFFGALLSRNQIYDSGGYPAAEGIELNNFHLIQSVGLKLGMKMSIFPVVKIPFSVEPFVLGTWKFSNTITGKGSPLYVSLGANASF